MFLDPESRSTVEARIQRSLIARGLNASTAGSIVNTVYSTFLDERGNVLRDIRYVGSMSFLSQAENGYLDLIGEDFFGLERVQESFASVTDLDSNLTIFVDTGTLADHLPIESGRYYVPSGLSIYDATSQIEYTTDRRIYVEEFANRAFVSASAVTEGPFSNVPAGTLISINLEGVSITNLGAIANGAGVETDDNYRFRISNAYVGIQEGNTTAIRLAALSTPGVSDVVVNARINGPGTTQVIVLPESNSVSPSVLEEVSSRINLVKAEESVVFVDAPSYASVQIEYSFSGRPLTETERLELTSSVQSAARDLIANLTFDDVLVPADAILPALSTTSGIIGKVEKLCIDGSTIPSKRYQLGQDELAILDITQTEPIKVYF